MAIKKSELYSSLWASCDELRGGMDASQYKDFVLVLLFVKYVSDKYAGQKDALLDVPKGGGFADMVAAKGDKEIGDKMNKIIAKLAEANDLKGVIDVADSKKSTGKAAINLPHGVLFRGGAEADIRKNIVRRGYVKGIIGLPANLFYGTGIPGCIIMLDKKNAAARKGIFMIDASKGFIKDGNKNRLRSQDIHKIADTFTRQVEIPRYSRMVPLAEISDPRNDFNLNLPRYIDSSEPEDLQDIDGHLNGGIPNRDIDVLENYWQVIPGVRTALFEPAHRTGYSKLKMDN